MTVSIVSLQFGFNIGALNAPTPLLKQFIERHFFLFREYHEVIFLNQYNYEPSTRFY